MFLRLVDPHDGLLSLTSIVLMGVFVKLMLAKTGPVDLGALLLALANYNAKKILGASAESPATTPQLVVVK